MTKEKIMKFVKVFYYDVTFTPEDVRKRLKIELENAYLETLLNKGIVQEVTFQNNNKIIKNGYCITEKAKDEFAEYSSKKEERLISRLTLGSVFFTMVFTGLNLLLK